MQVFDGIGGVLQKQSLLAFLWLTMEAEDWAGRLVMLAASAEAAPFALGTMAASGAVLWTCEDEALLRTSSMAGLIDFQVTTLSEALRILKNEIRKGLPVSVGVLDAGGTAWGEAVERGVQPWAVMAGARDAAAMGVLAGRGAAVLGEREDLQRREGVRLCEDVAANWRGRRDGDRALLAWAEELQDPERAVLLRWLRSAPRLFPRDTVRWYPGPSGASMGVR